MHEERSATGRRRVFHLLDAIRGVAALAVTQRHLAINLHLPNSGSFLAVDLFFVLSGFVIAHAYGEKLVRGEPVWRFMTVRVIRLYPLYLVGLVLGIVATAWLGRPSGAMVDGGTMAAAIAVALLMLLPFGLPPLDGPRWSLFYELVANLAYALVVRWLTPRNLLWILGLSALVLAIELGTGGTLDSGWAVAHAPVALGRVGYGFFAGVLCYQLHTGAASRVTAVIWGAALFAALALAAVLMPLKPFATLAVVLVGFPLIVWFGARYDVSGIWAKICAFLGVASYAIYIIHEPAGRLIHAVLLAGGYDLSRSRLAGAAVIAALLGACWVLDRYYDKPLRRWLNASLAKVSPAPRRAEREAVLDADSRTGELAAEHYAHKAG